METKELWNLYISKNIPEIYPDIFRFFSNKLPLEFLKEYDYEEVIIETSGQLRSAGEYEKAKEFIELIRNRHPDIYFDTLPFIGDFFVDYLLFHQQKEKVTEVSADYLKVPDEQLDELIKNFRKLIFHRETAIMESLMKKSFQAVRNSSAMTMNEEIEIADAKLAMEIEGQYRLFLQEKRFDRTSLLKALMAYHLEPDVLSLSIIEKGLAEDRPPATNCSRIS